MDKGQRKKKSSIGWLVILLILIGGVSVSLWYNNSPMYQVNHYIRAMNQGDYDKVYDMLLKEKMLIQFSKEEAVAYLKRYVQDIGFLRLEKGKKSYHDAHKAFYQVIYTTKKGQVDQILSLVKQGEAWQVNFPFKTYTLALKVPEGTEVMVNGRTVKSDRSGAYSLDVLPGAYTVRMIYPNGLQPDYVTKVSVPQTQEVISPYSMTPVEVQAPIGTIIALAGVQKQNTTGKVVFDQVLEGTYSLKVFDSVGYLEPVVQDLVVTKNLEPVHIKNMSISNQGEASFKKFLGSFYDTYLGSIRLGDVQGMEAYVSPGGWESIGDEFESWFIDHKQITKADMTIELDRMEIDPRGGVSATILEVVTLTNREPMENGKVVLKDYQVVLRWDAYFGMNASGYQLESRELLESIISSKDSKGKWVQY